MMSRPFSRLMDTNTLITAYSLRYTGFDGRRWQEGENKTTYGCYSEGYELVHTIPMKIWVTTDCMQNINITKIKYDSSKDPVYLENPYRLI
jgi:hypothetical protein